MAVRVVRGMDGESTPSPRKYEAGTAHDHTRLYKDTSKYGEVFTLDKLPKPVELRKMFHNDAQARQLFSAVRVIIKGAQWEVQPGDNDSGERDFVEWALTASPSQGGMTTPMRTVIGQMANAIAYRYSAFEKVWKASETEPYKGYHILHKLGYRPSTTVTLRTDANGSYNGFVQRAYKGNNFITYPFSPQRSLVYINGFDEAGIEGMTPFDTVYKNYLNKLKVSFFYFAFLENVAFPRTLVKVVGDDPDELQHLLDKARLFSSQGILGLYDTEEIESYESQRNTRDYQSALEYLNWEMARALLGQFLDLGTSGERGSFALSQDKSKFFFNTMESVLDDIRDVINEYIVSDLVRYNYGKRASYPVVEFSPLNDESATEVLETYRQVVMANAPNVTPDFMLKLMARVEQVLGLEIDPRAEFSNEEYLAIVSTIPTARDHLLSKENRAGSGQNPVTGEDRNENNRGGEGTVTESRPRQSSKTAFQDMNDSIDIVNQMRGPGTSDSKKELDRPRLQRKRRPRGRRTVKVAYGR
jgi:hypothetical protein